MLRVRLTSVFLQDQEHALRFYTDVLGFVKKTDLPLGGEARWLTVVAGDEPDGTEVVLEPASNPTDVASTVIAAFDDTCGNLVQIFQAP